MIRHRVAAIAARLFGNANPEAEREAEQLRREFERAERAVRELGHTAANKAQQVEASHRLLRVVFADVEEALRERARGR